MRAGYDLVQLRAGIRCQPAGGRGVFPCKPAVAGNGDDAMKKMHLLTVAVAAALASGFAFAQAMPQAPAAGKQRMQLDANKDGVVDRAEAARAPKLLERFDRLDTDKDGKLARDELRAQWKGMRHRGQDHRRGGDGMRRWDTDKDGRISRAEAEAAQSKLGERFDRMDVNKDGYIDRADM